MPALGPAVDDAIGVGVAQDAEIGRAEGLHAPVRGLGDFARRLIRRSASPAHRARDCPQAAAHTPFTRLIAASVDRPEAGRCAPMTTTGTDTFSTRFKTQAVLQGRRAVTDDDAGQIRGARPRAMAQRRQLAPFGEVDLGTGIAEIDGTISAISSTTGNRATIWLACMRLSWTP